MADVVSETANPTEVGEPGAAHGDGATFAHGTSSHELTAEQILASIVRSSDDAIIGKWLDGTIFSWNAGAERLYGYRAEEVLGRNVSILIPSSRRDELREILARVAYGERIGPLETVRRRKDGQPVHVWLTVSAIHNDAGEIIGASAIGRDITDQKRAEDRLQAAVEERTIELAEANQQLRLEIEQRKRAEAVVAGENRVLELIAAGTSPYEALATVSRTVEEHGSGLRCAIRAVAEGSASGSDAPMFGQASLFGLPATFPPDVGTRCVVADVRAEPLLNAWARRSSVQTLWTEPIIGSAGQVLGLIVVGRAELGEPAQDELEAGTAAARLAGIILERSRAEERARRQLAVLAHVSRMATMGEMASGLAHELNQPLCAIVNYTEACLEMLGEKPAQAELRRAMVEVAKQSERAGEVIRRLRGFVRRGEPQRVAVDVNAAVREVLSMTSADLRQQEVKVKLQLGKRLPAVLADAIQIQQVVMNLVRNAIDAMAETERSRRELRIKTRRRGPYIEVAVQDAGRGIDGEAGGRVFESFFTTKTHGLGMGLSISRSIIELHDGRIWVTPNAKGGVTFQFVLPLARRTRDVTAAGNRVRSG
jgi:PAS domain S-box-containing protein